MTLTELLELAEDCGALVVPDDVEGPEVILDSDAFERFTDAVYRAGTVFGLDLAQKIADNVRGDRANS